MPRQGEAPNLFFRTEIFRISEPKLSKSFIIMEVLIDNGIIYLLRTGHLFRYDPERAGDHQLPF